MMKRIVALILVIGVMTCSLTGCGGTKSSSNKSTTEVATTESYKTDNVYIGTEGDFGKYPMLYHGKLTPEKLLQGITDQTGWNLDLSEDISVDKDGNYKVSFAKSSVFYKGQKTSKSDEFYISGAENFYATVLDSVKQTLYKHYGKKGEKFNIYYYGPKGKTLEIKEIGQSLLPDVPYTTFYTYTPGSGKTNIASSGNTETYEVEAVLIKKIDDNFYKMRVGDETFTYHVTYRSLITVFKTTKVGMTMKLTIQEDKETGDKLVKKIYWRKQK